MAYNSTFTNDSSFSGKAILSAIGSYFTAFGNAMVATSGNNARLQKVERLQAKTDAELKEMGIKRDDIVHHVFRDLYYI